jgi:hypothetical protein
VKTFPEMTYAERDGYLADWLERQHDEALAGTHCDWCDTKVDWENVAFLCEDCYEKACDVDA